MFNKHPFVGHYFLYRTEQNLWHQKFLYRKIQRMTNVPSA